MLCSRQAGLRPVEGESGLGRLKPRPRNVKEVLLGELKGSCLGYACRSAGRGKATP